MDLDRAEAGLADLRFHSACPLLKGGALPAMVGLFRRWHDGQFVPVAIHRTFIEDDGKAWVKAEMDSPKMMLGPSAGAAIQVWCGYGGDAKQAKIARPGARPERPLVLAEGIEDALSAALVRPDLPCWAAGSLSAIGAVRLPRETKHILLVADNDAAETTARAFKKAAAAHVDAGRDVRVLRMPDGVKDANDFLRQDVLLREVGDA